MSLLDVYSRMAAEVAEVEQEKVASQEVDERMEVLEKYASWADQTLAAEYGENNYTVEDVEKLAEAKLAADAEELNMREKVAEAYELGQIMYAGFKAAANEDAE
jgi:hypothetical protein